MYQRRGTRNKKGAPAVPFLFLLFLGDENLRELVPSAAREVLLGEISFGFPAQFEVPMASWFLYICEKRDRLYVGITTDLENRLRQHGCPELLYKEGPLTRTEAVNRERQIKGWSRQKKLRLVATGPAEPE